MSANELRKGKKFKQSKRKLNKQRSNSAKQQKAISQKAKNYYREIKTSENFWRNNL